MRPILCIVLLVAGCGGSSGQTVQTLTVTPDELKALTYNMYYGLAADILPEDLNAGSLSASARSIINATSLTDFGCRIQAAAGQIVAEEPDVIGLQEALLIAYVRDHDDRSDDSTLIDFIDELIDAIQRAGGPKYRAFQRDNAVIQDTLPLVGGIRIADRGAILVHPRLAATEIGSLTFATLEPAGNLPGTGGVVVRGALHVRVPFAAGTLDFFSTHLQSGDAIDVREAQATELAAWIQDNSAADSTVVLTGDLNDVPASPTVGTFSSFLVDSYGTVGVLPGFTAYQAQSLSNPTDLANLRIDYVFVRSPAIEDSHLVFNAQAGPCNLWPSDHFGVVSRFRTNASLPPARR